MKKILLAGLVFLALSGCGGTPRPTGPGAPPCTPSVRATQGYNADVTIERYRFIGGSPDGARVAVLYSYFGPASRAPFAHVYGWQAGARAALFHRLRWMIAGGETELQACEQQVITDSLADMQSAGIVQGANVPMPLSWCADGDTAYLGAALQKWSWSTFAQTCAKGAAIEQWQLCRAGDVAACVTGTLDPEFDCGFTAEFTRNVSLLDAFHAGAVVWAVARKHVEPMPGTIFRAPFVSGSLVASPPTP